MNYLIWSNEHRGWWKGNRHGYTTRTDKAGRFSLVEAAEIVAQANQYLGPREVHEIMVRAPHPDQIKLDLEIEE